MFQLITRLSVSGITVLYGRY